MAWCVCWPGLACAGLYHRPLADEQLQPVPQWARFFDSVIPKLRSFAPPDPLAGLPPSPLRQQALQRIDFFARASDHALTADDFVDWSGWLVRLLARDNRPTLEEARRVVERGRSRFPRDWRLLAHLATVYQLSGEYERALALAQEALELAPAAAQRFERFHVRLILQRRLQEHERQLGRLPKDEAVLDDLFGQRWWERGLLPWPSGHPLTVHSTAPTQPPASAPPADAGEVLQQLLIWFPFDGQLWWLLGEYLVAQQEWVYAVQALQAASDLRVGGKVFRQRRAQVLDQAERLRAQNPTPAVPDIPNLDAASAPAQRTPLWARFDWQAWTLLLLGVGLLVLLAGWQLRIWTRQVLRRWRPPPSS
ncbi:hypothetical protein HRbin36_00700 [bacterium HR36]|nr:hypothetical protein HRbin36_00700 [bacterium HR36]